MEIKNIILAVGIFIMTMFVVVYGFSVFYPNVSYEDYCGKDIWGATNEQDCVSAGGVWKPETYYYPEENKPVAPRSVCSPKFGCDSEFQEAQEKRAKAVFYFSIPVGILIIIIGSFLFSLEAVAIGIMLGGLGTFVYGAGGYWRYGEEILRFILSLLGLIVLIVVAYIANKKFSLMFFKRNKKKKK